MERPDPARKLSANLGDIRVPLLCVQRKTPDDGQRNCPKHVYFYSKNKFVKLLHLAGFIIRTVGNCINILGGFSFSTLLKKTLNLVAKFTSTRT